MSAEMSGQLREQALTLDADLVQLPAEYKLQQVWGALMETGYEPAVASLVVFADGSTSLYFSTGGGVIGAGEHAQVRVAALAFLEKSEALLSNLTTTTETPLPGKGRVRFYVRTFTGIRTAEAGEQELAQGRHALSSLFFAGHDVIAEVRAMSEQKQ